MISPLQPGMISGRSLTDAAGNTLTPAQAVRLDREQGRVLIEVSAQPARLPSLAAGEVVAATVEPATEQGSGQLAVRIKGELFQLQLPQAAADKLPGTQLSLRVATLAPLAFALVDTQAPPAAETDTPATQAANAGAARALGNALQQLAEGEAVPLQTLAQPSGKLPAFQAGEWVNARVAEKLPDGSAVVLAKNVAFTLRAPANSPALQADPLLLRVRATEPQISFSQVSLDQLPSHEQSAPVRLSPATRYLSDLLQAAHRPADTAAPSRPLGAVLAAAYQLDDMPSPATSASIATGLPASPLLAKSGGVRPLLENPSQPADAHAAVLKQTVEKSGLFYESHQRAWVDGRISLEELKQEPQARLAATADTPARVEQAYREAKPELGHLVQRQLDTLEQKQFVFQGMAWPGQPVQWQIAPELANEREADGSEALRAWHTHLDLTLPALGGLSARLRMVGKQVQLVFDADNPEAAKLIEQHRMHLAGTMEAAGLMLASLQVKHDDLAHG